ncbi:hypothetical protein COU62_01305 [Candidatus Pacearchaeota archaeon CG10_big_fil_rev_8_21_14_0_10_35_219]|nr:hypothetical protein [Candidatus Pacearchaeota archaeon]OIO43073.1 MAG: hypothetical protein AUJ63_01470 [Candidatus Pacearchaeota archaeon CG1_02_35_32]PIO08197.1 MAG: hypothetical protein COU62_01305 [Candidatus Pacearchaeota archaeon CG10_big_fil_rev_8_21_14_0_10_35_219]PIY81130.1 MAG: hypothetical protein COY79_05010 [Candidatus Pacearchaeota archaeon CG_4_10_14_0_8_um_filter_35_169]PIZ79779.1 MAG: hypothetical protein COY00_03545 [Candidatus Pacearchaeota archaeon CG_4_10_14_0_2_um_filt
MVIELKKSINNGKVYFGVKQMVKNSKKIDLVFVPSDVRQETLEVLRKNKMDFDVLDVSKEEAAQKLELDFLCEVFSLGK